MLQRELAVLIDSDQATISKIEGGVINVSDCTKLKIAAALGCGVQELFPWPSQVTVAVSDTRAGGGGRRATRGAMRPSARQKSAGE